MKPRHRGINAAAVKDGRVEECRGVQNQRVLDVANRGLAEDALVFAVSHGLAGHHPARIQRRTGPIFQRRAWWNWLRRWCWVRFQWC